MRTNSKRFFDPGAIKAVYKVELKTKSIAIRNIITRNVVILIDVVQDGTIFKNFVALNVFRNLY